MRLSSDCVCRTIHHKEKGSTRPLVFLTPESELKYVRNTVAATLTRASCYGSSWRDQHGRVISVKAYSDPIPEYPGGFDLKVCNGGQSHTPQEVEWLERWRDGARSSD